MKKIILTKLNKATAAVSLHCEKKNTASSVSLFLDDAPSLIGTIYIGHVRDVVKNIDSAFVEYDKENLGYLPLKEANPVYLCVKNTDKICEGDNIIVQVVKDKIKTKDAVLTTNFSLTGKYAVLTHGRTGLSFSSKIRDEQFKKLFRQKFIDAQLKDIVELPYSIIVRTDGYTAAPQDILNEIEGLAAQYFALIDLAKTRQKFYILKKADSAIVKTVKDYLPKNMGKEDADTCEILTDNSEIYETLMETDILDDPNVSLRFYEDPLLPLYKLYSLENIFQDIYSRKVWMKSGAYLIIDYTEALTVIDVNTGKCEKGKSKEKTLYNINIEAAKEIARQLRIRNISGIVIIDFIDMVDENDTKNLLEYMRSLVSSDPIKTTVVDITKLHLMELTRKKTTDKIPYIPDLFHI